MFGCERRDMTLRSVSTKAVLFSLRMKLWSITFTAKSMRPFFICAWNTYTQEQQSKQHNRRMSVSLACSYQRLGSPP